MPHPDLTPAADALAAIVSGVRDDQLTAPTPCEGLSVGDLLHHVEGLALGFTMAARKETEVGGPPPSANAADLAPDWREVVPERLRGLATAWSDPAAWSGDTAIGGVAQTGAECGATAADELVVHAWDLARATGQEYVPDDEAVSTALRFVEPIAAAMPDGVPGLFTAPRPVPADATAFDRLLLLTGRDPGSAV